MFDYYLKGNSQVQFQEILRQLQQVEAFYQEACEKSKKGEQFYSKENVLQQWQAFYDKVAVENHLK